MDLFDYMRENTMKNESPLASRLRPSTLDEVVGQQHIIGKDKLLYRAIKADKISRYFSEDYSNEQIENVIYQLLDEWNRSNSEK